MAVNASDIAVEFNKVNIVFGAEPEKALPLMDKGMNRTEIQKATGQVLGVHGQGHGAHQGCGHQAGQELFLHSKSKKRGIGCRQIPGNLQDRCLCLVTEFQWQWHGRRGQ